MKLRQKSRGNCILAEVSEAKTGSCFSLLPYAPSLLPSKRPCFLFEPETGIDDPEFGVYIVVGLLGTVMSPTPNMEARPTR